MAHAHAQPMQVQAAQPVQPQAHTANLVLPWTGTVAAPQNQQYIGPVKHNVAPNRPLSSEIIGINLQPPAGQVLAPGAPVALNWVGQQQQQAMPAMHLGQLSQYDPDVFRPVETGDAQNDIRDELIRMNRYTGPYYQLNKMPGHCLNPNFLFGYHNQPLPGNNHLTISATVWEKLYKRKRYTDYRQCLAVITKNPIEDRFFPFYLHTRPTFYGQLDVAGVHPQFPLATPASQQGSNPPPTLDGTLIPNLWYVTGELKRVLDLDAMQIPVWKFQHVAQLQQPNPANQPNVLQANVVQYNDLPTAMFGSDR